MHKSVRLEHMPVEFINVTPINPLISKCQIKVCYVGDEPNRNRSIITKEVARSMANSLPGSPIVGYYNEENGDFEEHNRAFTIKDGKFEIKDTTRPYGFVDLNAKVWFAKYLDDDKDEREYMVTEGYLWTGQYPESRRILEGNGNNHSMELDQDTIDATWSKGNNGKPQFFIINEAIISKLCVLGEEFEPCFEGSSITAPTIQFSFENGFKEQLFSMMNELKDLLNKEEQKVFTRYAVTIGDALWTALYSHVESNYANHRIESVCEEGEQKFAVLQADDKFYRLNFSVSEEGTFSFESEVSELDSYTPEVEPQFSLADIEAYAKKKKEEEDKEDKEDKKNPEDKSEGSEDNEDDSDDKKPAEGSDDEDDEDEKKKKKEKKFSLEEIPEYIELQTKYSDLETQYNLLKSEKEELEAKLTPLAEFKAAAEKKEKEALIDSFYMLSDDDKKDVVDNIDTYSLDDIEAKLSIICVRNKVSFNLDDDKEPKGPTTYNLGGAGEDDLSGAPAWVKAALKVAETMN